MKENKLMDLLLKKGFKTIENNSSEYFGDYYNILSDGKVMFRLSNSRSHYSIDITNAMDKENWHDLSLVKSLLYKEVDLTKTFSKDDYIRFLTKELDTIINMFNEKKYPETENKMQTLKKERVKQLFPNIKTGK